MAQYIKTESVDINELICKNNTSILINSKSKMINILYKELTDEEYRWYIANLYIYINYHPTTDFPINLDTLVKLIGFSNKANAKRTLKNNFVENEDYKTTIEPDLKERIMMNVDTFKNMCMLVKTEKSKKIRRYYAKLECIYNNIAKEEI